MTGWGAFWNAYRRTGMTQARRANARQQLSTTASNQNQAAAKSMGTTANSGKSYIQAKNNAIRTNNEEPAWLKDYEEFLYESSV